MTLTNTGNQTLTLSGFSVNGDFAQTNNCPRFRSGEWPLHHKDSVPADAIRWTHGLFFHLQHHERPSQCHHHAQRDGVEGVEALTVTNKGIIFAPQVVGTSSPAQNVVVINSGNAPVSIFGTASSLPDYTLTGAYLNSESGRHLYGSGNLHSQGCRCTERDRNTRRQHERGESHLHGFRMD